MHKISAIKYNLIISLVFRHVYAANGWYRIDSGEGNWPVTEISDQITLSRASSRRALGSLGNIGFSGSYLRDNYKGLLDEFKALNPDPVPVPDYPWIGSTNDIELDESRVVIEGRKVTVDMKDFPMDINRWMISKVEGARLRLVDILPRFQNAYEVKEDGRYCVQSRNRANQNSGPFFFDIQ